MIKVLPESVSLNIGSEWAMCRSKNSHVGAAHAAFADPPEFAFVQRTEKKGLKATRQFAKLIKEKGPAVRCFEQTRPFVSTASKCALRMTKEFRLSQLNCYCSAVHGDERTVSPLTASMQCARKEFFASPTLAQNEDPQV
jgi:hypothetical protein